MNKRIRQRQTEKINYEREGRKQLQCSENDHVKKPANIGELRHNMT